MDFLAHYDPEMFSRFALQIRSEVEEWQVIEVGLTGSHNASYIAHKICDHFKDKEGVTLIVNQKAILVLVNLGRSANLQAVAMRIRKEMPPQSCSVVASGVTGDGLARLQLHVHESGLMIDTSTNEGTLLNERMGRKERVVLIVDDDRLVRKVIGGTFQSQARIIEQSSGDSVVDIYLEHLPDVVFLDLNLPSGSGMDVLEEMLSFDESAYVVIITGDGARDKVITARTNGAKGFLVKPLSPKKLIEVYKKCPSIPAQEDAAAP